MNTVTADLDGFVVSEVAVRSQIRTDWRYPPTEFEAAREYYEHLAAATTRRKIRVSLTQITAGQKTLLADTLAEEHGDTA